MLTVMEERLKFLVVVSIDTPERMVGGKFPTSKVYYSDLLDTAEDVDAFLEQVNEDFPDNNMKDYKVNHKYIIRYVKFRVDPDNSSEIETIKKTARACKHYKEAVKEN